MKSNVAFEVLDEVDVYSESSRAGSSVFGGLGVVSGDGASSAEQLDQRTPTHNEMTSALAALEIDDDLPLSVSPMMNRKIDVRRILSAVNKTLPHD